MSVDGRGSRALRVADRVVGVPMLGVLGLARRRRRLDGAPRSIGVLRTAAIGDTVLLSGPARDLRRAFPEARLLLFAGPSNRGLAPLLPMFDEVVPLPLRLGAAVRALRAKNLDLVIDTGQWPRFDALLAALSGAVSVGFRTPGQGRHWAFDVPVRHSDRVHELDNYRALLRALGVPVACDPQLVVPDDATMPAGPGGSFAVLHLWPGGYRAQLKEWPLDRWRVVADALRADGLRVVLTGATADAERTRAAAATLAATSVAGCSLTGAAQLLAGADVVVSVNTGVMHMAAALGAPTVGLNGPTSSRRWGPVGPSVASVDSRRPGCGFLNLGAEYRGRPTDCMEGIEVDDVLEAAARVRVRMATSGRR